MSVDLYPSKASECVTAKLCKSEKAPFIIAAIPSIAGSEVGEQIDLADIRLPSSVSITDRKRSFSVSSEPLSSKLLSRELLSSKLLSEFSTDLFSTIPLSSSQPV